MSRFTKIIYLLAVATGLLLSSQASVYAARACTLPNCRRQYGSIRSSAKVKGYDKTAHGKHIAKSSQKAALTPQQQQVLTNYRTQLDTQKKQYQTLIHGQTTQKQIDQKHKVAVTRIVQGQAHANYKAAKIKKSNDKEKILMSKQQGMQKAVQNYRDVKSNAKQNRSNRIAQLKIEERTAVQEAISRHSSHRAIQQIKNSYRERMRNAKADTQQTIKQAKALYQTDYRAAKTNYKDEKQTLIKGDTRHIRVTKQLAHRETTNKKHTKLSPEEQSRQFTERNQALSKEAQGQRQTQNEFNQRKSQAKGLLKHIEDQERVERKSKGRLILTNQGVIENPEYTVNQQQKNLDAQAYKQQKTEYKEAKREQAAHIKQLRKMHASKQQIKLAKDDLKALKMQPGTEKQKQVLAHKKAEQSFKKETQQRQKSMKSMAEVIKQHYKVDNRTAAQKARDNFVRIIRAPFTKQFWTNPATFFELIGATIAAPMTGGTSLSWYATSTVSPIGAVNYVVNAGVDTGLEAAADQIPEGVGRNAFMGVAGTIVPRPSASGDGAASAATAATSVVYGSSVDGGKHAADVWQTVGFGALTTAVMMGRDLVNVPKNMIAARKMPAMGYGPEGNIPKVSEVQAFKVPESLPSRAPIAESFVVPEKVPTSATPLKPILKTPEATPKPSFMQRVQTKVNNILPGKKSKEVHFNEAVESKTYSTEAATNEMSQSMFVPLAKEPKNEREWFPSRAKPYLAKTKAYWSQVKKGNDASPPGPPHMPIPELEKPYTPPPNVTPTPTPNPQPNPTPTPERKPTPTPTPRPHITPQPTNQTHEQATTSQLLEHHVITQQDHQTILHDQQSNNDFSADMTDEQQHEQHVKYILQHCHTDHEFRLTHHQLCEKLSQTRRQIRQHKSLLVSTSGMTVTPQQHQKEQKATTGAQHPKQSYSKAMRAQKTRHRTQFNPNQVRLSSNPQSPTTELDKIAVGEEDKVLNLGAKLDIDYSAQHLKNTYQAGGPKKFVIGLASISGLLRISDWVNAYSSAIYSENPNSTEKRHFDPKVDQAYVSVGNFHRSPWHGSIGYMYFPFGVYVPFSFTANVNQTFDTTQAKGISFGYQGSHIYSVAYTFNNSGKVNQQNRNNLPIIQNWGSELGVVWHNDANTFGLNSNVAYLNNFNETNLVSNLHPVNIARKGAVAAHIQLFYKQVGWVADYTVVAGPYNQAAFQYNNHGAMPQALTNQVYYHFHTFGKPSTIAANFQTSHQALAFAVPKWQTTVFYAIEFNRHVSLEVQTALWQDYNMHQSSVLDTRSGPIVSVGTGKHNYMIGARLSIALGNDHPDYPSV